MTNTKPTIAILGTNKVVESTLAVLLRGIGYDTRTTEALSTERVEVLLEGVDLVLIFPGLGAGRQGESLASLRAGARRMAVPVLQLSSVLEKGLFPDEVAVLPWPSGFEEVSRVIEGALTPAAPAGAEGAGASP